VTGFGLLGHLRKMAVASGVDAAVEVAAVPLFDGVRALAAAGTVPGGSRRNREWVADALDLGPGVTDVDVAILADAQTSGGLLFGAEPDLAAAAVAELTARGVPAAVIGRAVSGTGRIALS
jgi:selenide,water dikinase